MVTPPPSGASSQRSRLQRAGVAVFTFAFYLLLAFFAFWPVSPLDRAHLPGCACADPAQQTWFLAWTSHALTHGLNPLLTSFLNVPAGANLAIDTSMPLLGVVGMPVTLLAGPVATFNLLLRLGLALSATSMFIVLRRYTNWWPAAFGGGLLFGFSAYMTGQAERHLFLVFVPLVPLLIPLLDDWLVSRRRSPLWSGALVGAVAGLEYLISPEIVLASALVAAVGLAYLALRYRQLARLPVGPLVRGLAVAAVVFAVIAGYTVWLLLAGPGRPAGPLHTLTDLTRYHGDLLAPFVPTSNQAITPAGLAGTGNRLVAGRRVENGFYLGVPLALLLCYLTFRCRRVPLVAATAVAGAVAFVLSLGPTLTADGRVILGVMPFALLEHVALLQDLEAARLSLYLQLAAAVIFGVGLDQVRAHGWRAASRASAIGTSAPGAGTPASGVGTPAPGTGNPAAGTDSPAAGAGTLARRTLLVALAGLIALAPVVPRLPFHSRPVTTPPLFSSSATRLIPPGAVALTFPYSRAPHNDPMLWQAASGMRFRIIGGDAFVPGPGGSSTWRPDPVGAPVILRVLLAGTAAYPGPPTDGEAVAAVRQLCATYRVGVVLVDPSAEYGRTVAGLMHRALRARPLKVGQMDVWLHPAIPAGRGSSHRSGR